MSQINMVIVGKDQRKTIKKVEEKLRDSLTPFMVQLPIQQITPRGRRDWLIPKANYTKVTTESQRLLTDSSMATDVFALLSAIESEHEAIYFEN